MAEVFYAQIAPHLYAGPIEAAANIHYGTSLPNFLILESIETFGGFYAKLLKKPIRWEDGFVIPPTEPASASNSTKRSPRRIPTRAPSCTSK